MHAARSSSSSKAAPRKDPTVRSKPIPIRARAAIPGRSAGARPAPISSGAWSGPSSNATTASPIISTNSPGMWRRRSAAPDHPASIRCDGQLRLQCRARKSASSTLLKLHKAGDYAGAKAEFARWNKAAGKVWPGLTAAARRSRSFTAIEPQAGQSARLRKPPRRIGRASLRIQCRQLSQRARLAGLRGNQIAEIIAEARRKPLVQPPGAEQGPPICRRVSIRAWRAPCKPPPSGCARPRREAIPAGSKAVAHRSIPGSAAPRHRPPAPRPTARTRAGRTRGRSAVIKMKELVMEEGADVVLEMQSRDHVRAEHQVAPAGQPAGAAVELAED